MSTKRQTNDFGRNSVNLWIFVLNVTTLLFFGYCKDEGLTLSLGITSCEMIERNLLNSIKFPAGEKVTLDCHIRAGNIVHVGIFDRMIESTSTQMSNNEKVSLSNTFTICSVYYVPQSLSKRHHSQNINSILDIVVSVSSSASFPNAFLITRPNANADTMEIPGFTMLWM